jgi:hypothetical protein
MGSKHKPAVEVEQQQIKRVRPKGYTNLVKLGRPTTNDLFADFFWAIKLLLWVS